MLELLNWVVNIFYSRGQQYSPCLGPRFLTWPKFQAMVSSRDGSRLECPESTLSCLISSVQTSVRSQLTNPGSFLLTNGQHTATQRRLMETERLLVPNVLNLVLCFALQTAFICLKHLNQNSSFHVNTYLHYTEVNVPELTLLQRKREARASSSMAAY